MKAKTAWLIAAVIAAVVAVVLLVVLLPKNEVPKGEPEPVIETPDPEQDPEPADPFSIAGHKWVDMGTGIKWATTNIGANAPEEGGDFFSWGETATREVYDWKHYSNGVSSSEGGYDTKKSILSGRNLKKEYDAASQLWGESWRMPTSEEMSALLRGCTSTWTTINGVNGYLLKSKTTDGEIFFPAAGFMEGSKLKYAGTHAYVWSSTDFGEGNAHLLYMKVNTRLQVGCYFECCYGHNIRPVSD